MAKSFKPTNLKIIMSMLLVIAISGIIALYVVVSGSRNATTTNTTGAISTHTSDEVSALKQFVDNNQSAVTTVDNFIPTSSTAQTSVVDAIDKAASLNNVTITGKTFTKQTNVTDLTTVTGLTTNYVTITFASSIKYDNFIKFLKSIENSSPKMQVMNLSVTPAANTSQITVTPMTIGYYQR